MTHYQDRASLGRRVARHARQHVVGYIALFVALTLTPIPSYAAALIGTNDIKKGAVTTPKLHKDAVTTAKLDKAAVNTKALKKKAVTKSRLAAEARGLRDVVVRVNTESVSNATAGAVTADCASNEVATGGGGLLNGAFTDPVFIRTYPSVVGGETSLSEGAVPQAWTTRIYNDTGSTATLRGYVICASK